MAETSYQYVISTDTANGVVATDSLWEEIIADSVVIITPSSINVSGDTLTIIMQDSINEPDLASIVNLHEGVALADEIQTVKLSEEDPDTGGVSFTPRFAPPGWFQQIFELEFETCTDSIHEKDYLDNDIGWAVCKFYKSDGSGGEIECIDQADRDINCTRTDLEWMPDIDYMIKGGWIAQITAPDEEIYVWAQAVVLPDIYGGVQSTFAEGGINLRYMEAKQRNGMDGVAGTILYYSHPQLGDGIGTNKIRFVIRHPAGYKHRLQCIFDIFRA